jgi:inorganic phosphate transporter, PiT family
LDADLTVAIVVATALAFDFTNGFHDTANVVATSISTRAMGPEIAVAYSALMNFAGAFLSLEVATTVANDLVAVRVEPDFLLVVFGGLVGAITWNLVTWYLGVPSSSSHALIGGLVGAALASATQVKWAGVFERVVIPMIVSPLVGFTVAALLMIVLLWVFRRGRPGPLNRGFRVAQTVSASAMALGHGLQDAQKTMGVIFLALLTVGHVSEDDRIPLWVIVSAAAAISLGTYAGGWRIMRTLGRRIIHLDPPRGFAAEATASGVLYTMAIGFGAPISTTHTITSAVMGVGATKRLSAVRWGVAGNIVGAWVLTIPMAGLMAAASYGIIKLLTPA